MLIVRFTPAAGRQLNEIRSYIPREASDSAADAMVARLTAAIAGLTDAPAIDRASAGGTRELTTVRPYVIRYRVSSAFVTVVRIRHGARRPTE